MYAFSSKKVILILCACVPHLALEEGESGHLLVQNYEDLVRNYVVSGNQSFRRRGSLKGEGDLVDYSVVPSKHPWVLGIHRPIIGGGRLHGETIQTYMYIKNQSFRRRGSCAMVEGMGRGILW